MALFGPSEEELDRLRSTVRSLGATSVPGLAAALSWRARKAEKLLAAELARPGTPLVYEPARRLVRWGLSGGVASPSGPTGVPEALPPSLPRVPRAPPPALTSSGLKTLCPHCHVPLLTTGSTNLAVCPECGRLASPRSSAGGTPEPLEAPAARPPSAGPGPTPTLSLGDRRAQELFAAYVTSRPIPCPKCRTPLRHRSVSEYGCPTCGEVVRFPSANEGALPPRLGSSAGPGGPSP